MDISHILDNLNDKQREAVASPLDNYLVLAGAGSGKTKVLTQRIAYLMTVEGISHNQILAVTFTNKAAAEMRHRITLATNHQINLSQMWVGTFHSIAHRILRTYHNDANLPKDFQILDSEDQQRLVKRLMKLHQFDEKTFPSKQVCWFINHHKEEGRRPQDIEIHNKYDKAWIELYKIYQEVCNRTGLIDFSEMLLRVYELFMHKPLILQNFQHRFNQILVDEFQDTNNIQYQWIKLLAGKHNNLMIVGDDDQSIYGWRGAKIENLQYFLKDFPNAKTIRLEQNYRSTGNILKTANHLISHNSDRLGKNLWTQGEQGEKVGIYSAFNDLDETLFVIEQIQKWHEQQGKFSDCAILYRNNSLSLNFEKALANAQIPYRIYGGLRFFDRQEVKDALAYLRLIANPNDDASFERVINTPPRGIGNRTLEILRDITKNQGVTLWQACQIAIEQNVFPARSQSSLWRFMELIAHLKDKTMSLPLHQQLEKVIHDTGLYAMYEKEKGDKGEVRIENLEVLINYAKEFVPEDSDDDLLIAFLTHASLEAGENQAKNNQDCVQMMTMHNAKGLEFERVFIVGVEEGIFPSQMAIEENRLEEERRLAYVGITRAKRELTLCFAESRSLYGKSERRFPSRFLNELPNECVQEIRLRGNLNQKFTPAKPKLKPEDSSSPWKIAQKVQHPKFGIGTIVNIEGDDDHLRLQIAFQGEGVKWLMAKFANLTPV